MKQLEVLTLTLAESDQIVYGRMSRGHEGMGGEKTKTTNACWLF